MKEKLDGIGLSPTTLYIIYSTKIFKLKLYYVSGGNNLRSSNLLDKYSKIKYEYKLDYFHFTSSKSSS